LRESSQENKIIINDIHSMKKGLLDQMEKKEITRQELVFHNDVLKKTLKVKQDEEEQYYKQKQEE